VKERKFCLHRRKFCAESEGECPVPFMRENVCVLTLEGRVATEFFWTYVLVTHIPLHAAKILRGKRESGWEAANHLHASDKGTDLQLKPTMQIRPRTCFVTLFPNCNLNCKRKI
jgi:hypothetical protein